MLGERKDELAVYCVYRNPSDFPGQYVIRRFVGEKPDQRPLIVSFNYMVAISYLPPGLVKMARHEDDDPCIMETWI